MVMTAGVGIGIWLATTSDQVSCFRHQVKNIFARYTGDVNLIRSVQLDNRHPIIGLVVFSLMFFQPILGIAHHMIYRRKQSRTAFAHVHMWLGRALIILGVINGGLGLDLSENTTKGEVAYGVIAGIVFVVYLLALAFAWNQNKKAGGVRNDGKVGGNGVDYGQRSDMELR